MPSQTAAGAPSVPSPIDAGVSLPANAVVRLADDVADDAPSDEPASDVASMTPKEATTLSLSPWLDFDLFLLLRRALCSSGAKNPFILRLRRDRREDSTGAGFCSTFSSEPCATAAETSPAISALAEVSHPELAAPTGGAIPNPGTFSASASDTDAAAAKLPATSAAAAAVVASAGVTAVATPPEAAPASASRGAPVTNENLAPFSDAPLSSGAGPGIPTDSISWKFVHAAEFGTAACSRRQIDFRDYLGSTLCHPLSRILPLN